MSIFWYFVFLCKTYSPLLSLFSQSFFLLPAGSNCSQILTGGIKSTMALGCCVYRPASLGSLAGRYDNLTYARANNIPQQETEN
jgi:hypothetical protein